MEQENNKEQKKEKVEKRERSREEKAKRKEEKRAAKAEKREKNKKKKEERIKKKKEKREKKAQEKPKQKKSFKEWYDKNYKLLLIIPLLILVFSIGYLIFFYVQNNDIIHKDVSLTGGTTLTIHTSQSNIDILDLKQNLLGKFDDVIVREISNLRTGKQEAVVVEINTQPDEIKLAVEQHLGYELNDENSSVEFTGSSLSQNFYRQLIIAIIIAFVFMAVVVLIIFRKFMPSFIVILSAFADIIMTLALVDFLGMKLSSAGIIAFLMLIGYSVDTDIMLTTKIIRRREGEIDSRIFQALKTGMTMTLTSIIAIFAAFIITMSFSQTLKQIFSVLLIGLGFDLINTWITNASLLKLSLEKKRKK